MNPELILFLLPISFFAVSAGMMAILAVVFLKQTEIKKMSRHLSVSWWSLVALLITLFATASFLEVPIRTLTPNPVTLCAFLFSLASLTICSMRLIQAALLVTRGVSVSRAVR